MSYIDETLLPQEVVLYRSKPHWIVFVWPVLIALATVILCFWTPDTLNTKLSGLEQMAGVDARMADDLNRLTFLIGVLGTIGTLAATAGSIINFFTSEFGITNKRVLMKEGFFQRTSLEIYLPKIESVKVEQNILGRGMDFGSLIICGVGGSKDVFKNIPYPLEFRRRIQAQIEAVAPHKEHTL
jgi:hypothetical protein